jgi:glycosyltransferase involved in cell wall biosynthesis
MANEIRKYLEPDEGIAITPFGVDTDLFHPGIANNDGVFRVGMIKNLEPGCGGDTLIRAFAIFLGKVGAASPCRLMLAGDGSCRVAYEALARDLGIRGKVEFLGKLGHRDVPDYLRGLDAYCGPSEEESFGVAFLEAQATGLPVVATRVGGIPEVVADNDSAFLVAVGDHEAVADRLLTLFKTPDLRTRMGQHGRNFVESRYRWSASVDAMLAIYAKIAAGDSGFRE